MYLKEKNTDIQMNVLHQGLKSKYVEMFLIRAFDKVGKDYFKLKIEPTLLATNLINKILKDSDDMSFVATSLVLQDKALSYYESKGNEIMILFIKQSILESHLMYLENDYMGHTEVIVNENEESLIEHIVEKAMY